MTLMRHLRPREAKAILRLSWAACAALVLLAIGGCPAAPADGTLVIGVISEFHDEQSLDRLDIEMSVDGEQVSKASHLIGPSAGMMSFPAELRVENLADNAQVTVGLRGYVGDELRVSRHLTTLGVASLTLFFRVRLEAQCGLYPPGSEQPSAAQCDGPELTCIAGKCRESFVPIAALEPYHEDWSKGTADICKPAGAGAPVVIVGEGQADYLPMDDFAHAQVEAGPQGGHHIWVAARIKNLNRSGSVTTVGGAIPDLGLSVAPLKVIFTFDPQDGGYCKLFGLRFQIDIGGQDVHDMLGLTMKVVVDIVDPRGDHGSGQRWVTLSSDLI